MENTEQNNIGFFARNLFVWVVGCIVLGVLVGIFLPGVPQFLGQLEYANISIPIAILIWLMIYPMMLKVDFQSILQVGKKPKGLLITLFINWLVKPFTMYFFAWLFFKVLFRPWIPENSATEYIAGAILLGAAPCTAMVFVWSYLSDGDPAYTIVQVAVNDLVILFAFAPIVALLLGIGKVEVPLDTLFLSLVLFVVIPFTAGFLTRTVYLRKRSTAQFAAFCHRFNGWTEAGLLLTLVMIFSFQGKHILTNPLSIALIAVPLLIQTYFVFFAGFGLSRLFRVPYQIAVPSGMIGASNFFELAVAVSISLFGLSSGATLATVVGVLVEVPLMLSLVRIAKLTKQYF